MYVPAAFAETRSDVLHQLIAARPLATLITLGADGLNANLIPLQLAFDGSPLGCLRGHVARANPLLNDLGSTTAALAVFHGGEAYISPSWYPGKVEHGKVVPTWNYIVVEARGELRPIDDPAWLRWQIEALTAQQESASPQPWSVAEAPADYIERMLGAIVGIELRITRLTGKSKLSQNQNADTRAGVAAGLRQCGGDAALAMASWVESGAS